MEYDLVKDSFSIYLTYAFITNLDHNIFVSNILQMHLMIDF